MKIIFIDMDGVFNRYEDPFYLTLNVNGMRNTIEKSTVEYFNYILSKLSEDTKVVVSSSWRAMFETAQEFCEVTGFPLERFHEDWRTYNAGKGENNERRAYDIEQWLDYHPDVRGYVILDDIDFHFDRILGKGHFIKTDPKNGLTLFDVERMLKILGVGFTEINGYLILHTQ